LAVPLECISGKCKGQEEKNLKEYPRRSSTVSVLCSQYWTAPSHRGLTPTG